MKHKKYLHTPIASVPVNKRANIRDVLLSMSKASFQGRQLGEALLVWEEMLDKGCYVFMGLAGAMVPAGMRGVIEWLIREEKIHCLVSTGANLFHELHECIGRHHYKGHPDMDDVELRECGIDRIYDTLAHDKEFLDDDRFILDFSRRNFEKGENVTTAEFFRRLGKYLKNKGKKGFIVTAYEKAVPIYCSALGDSSYGIALAAYTDERIINFDIIQDARDLGKLIIEHPKTGVIYLGGGHPKNFIQQAEIIAAQILETSPRKKRKRDEINEGHLYAVQISTDAPHWGGLSGCPLQEGQSWGKEHPNAAMVNLYCDATIALPLLANALAQKRG